MGNKRQPQEQYISPLGVIPTSISQESPGQVQDWNGSSPLHAWDADALQRIDWGAGNSQISDFEAPYGSSIYPIRKESFNIEHVEGTKLSGVAIGELDALDFSDDMKHSPWNTGVLQEIKLDTPEETTKALRTPSGQNMKSGGTDNGQSREPRRSARLIARRLHAQTSGKTGLEVANEITEASRIKTEDVADKVSLDVAIDENMKRLEASGKVKFDGHKKEKPGNAQERMLVAIAKSGGNVACLPKEEQSWLRNRDPSTERQEKIFVYIEAAFNSPDKQIPKEDFKEFLNCLGMVQFHGHKAEHISTAINRILEVLVKVAGDIGESKLSEGELNLVSVEIESGTQRAEVFVYIRAALNSPDRQISKEGLEAILKYRKMVKVEGHEPKRIYDFVRKLLTAILKAGGDIERCRQKALQRDSNDERSTKYQHGEGCTPAELGRFLNLEDDTKTLILTLAQPIIRNACDFHNGQVPKQGLAKLREILTQKSKHLRATIASSIQQGHEQTSPSNASRKREREEIPSMSSAHSREQSNKKPRVSREPQRISAAPQSPQNRYSFYNSATSHQHGVQVPMLSTDDRQNIAPTVRNRR